MLILGLACSPDPVALECWVEDSLQACQVAAAWGEADAGSYGAACDCKSIACGDSVDWDDEWLRAEFAGICDTVTKDVVYTQTCSEVIDDRAEDCYCIAIDSACQAIADALGCPPPT